MHPAPSVELVTELLQHELPALAAESVRLLRTSGTEHHAYRVGQQHLLRIPRDDEAAAGLVKEVTWLRQLAGRLPLELPEAVHLGEPSDAIGQPWAVTTWVEGDDASARVLAGSIPSGWADALAELVLALRAVDLSACPREVWPVGNRGGHLRARVAELHAAADPVAGRPDSSSIEALVRRALAQDPPPAPPVLLHADLIPGNLVVRGDRLTGLIDLGTLTTGIAAWDLTPAWWVLAPEGRRRFREALEVDEASWAWGRALAATQGLLAHWYYAPRQHDLAPLGARAVREAVSDHHAAGSAG